MLQVSPHHPLFVLLGADLLGNGNLFGHLLAALDGLLIADLPGDRDLFGHLFAALDRLLAAHLLVDRDRDTIPDRGCVVTIVTSVTIAVRGVDAGGVTLLGHLSHRGTALNIGCGAHILILCGHLRDCGALVNIRCGAHILIFCGHLRHSGALVSIRCGAPSLILIVTLLLVSFLLDCVMLHSAPSSPLSLVASVPVLVSPT